MLLALSRRLTRWLNKVLLYLLLLSDLSEGTWNTFKKGPCYSLVRDHLCGIRIPKRKFMTSRSKVCNDKPLKHFNYSPITQSGARGSQAKFEKTSTPPLPCSNIQAIFASKLYPFRSFSVRQRFCVCKGYNVFS